MRNNSTSNTSRGEPSKSKHPDYHQFPKSDLSTTERNK